MRITASIRSGHYQPGDQLPSERDLMAQFGVGRPAVREALLTLQRLGLVEVRSGLRAKVTKPSPQSLIHGLSSAAEQFLAEEQGVRQLQDARLFLEVGLVRHAAVHATAEDLDKLREALLANKRAIGDPEAFTTTDVDFHFVLSLAKRNSIFLAVHEAVVQWLAEQRQIALHNPNEDRIAYAAHEAIFNAIADRDPDEAERRMRAHLAQVADVYWRVKRRRKDVSGRSAPELA